MLYNSEKKGGLPKSFHQLKEFWDVVEICKFVDMGFEGYPYIWSNGRMKGNNIQQRIDQAFSIEDFLTLFPHYRVVHGPRHNLDHCPLIITIETLDSKYFPKKKGKFLDSMRYGMVNWVVRII